jgi:hypothetical protein
MQTTIRPLASLWAGVRDQIRGSRAAHVSRAALERELASYNSQSDLDDLHAILDRYSERDTAQIRRILAAQHSPLATRR